MEYYIYIHVIYYNLSSTASWNTMGLHLWRMFLVENGVCSTASLASPSNSLPVFARCWRTAHAELLDELKVWLLIQVAWLAWLLERTCMGHWGCSCNPWKRLEEVMLRWMRPGLGTCAPKICMKCTDTSRISPFPDSTLDTAGVLYTHAEPKDIGPTG